MKQTWPERSRGIMSNGNLRVAKIREVGKVCTCHWVGREWTNVCSIPRSLVRKIPENN